MVTSDALNFTYELVFTQLNASKASLERISYLDNL